MLSWLLFILAIIISVFVHELGHFLAAIWCKVKVEAFSIGFGKPCLSKKIKGVVFRLAPLLLGGYTKVKGEFTNVKGGFLEKKYWKKALICSAGVFMNILVVCGCYWFNYKSISLGLFVDWQIIKATIAKDPYTLVAIFIMLKPNIFLLILGLVNTFALLNLLPLPPLDGGILWLVLFKRKWGVNYEKISKRICLVGYIFLTLSQLIFLWWLFFT